MTNSPPKHALITGAAVRVGRSIALHLARFGWDITIHYRHSKAEAEVLAQEIITLGQRADTLAADFSRPESVTSIFTSLSRPVDLLIHNASVFEKDGLSNLTAEKLQAHMNVNLFSPLLLTQGFIAQLPKNTRGDVICLLDGLIGWSISPHYLSYSLSKLSLRNAITLLARSLAPEVRINGITLGATLAGKEDSPSTFEKIRSLTPLHTTSSEIEVCAAIDFLLASASTTGQILDLSSGMTLPAVYATQ